MDPARINQATPDAPERGRLRIGFVALSDAAPLVAAKRLELGERYGLTLELCRQPSWASIRDKLLSGELDAAHALYGLVYGVQLGIGGPRAEMAVPMVLNRNGQAITFSNRLADAHRASGNLKAALATLGRRPVFAQTFPTGTHAMWLYHWLASHGVDPLRDIRSVVIPPPEMVGALAAGELDGLCVGEPWNAVAEARGAGRTVAATSEVWRDHPEKALACRREFVALYPNAARLLVRTLLDACAWLDDPAHRMRAAQWLAKPDAIGVPVEQIAPRLLGDYGAGPFAQPPAPIRFYSNGTANRPAASDGLWFLSQYRRWGMLSGDVDDAAIANGVAQTAIYDEAVALAGVRGVD
ncbi:ABC transporter substrate-binding protein [Burkholderia humptydooensis]|uniref:ABC transporter substrate-binding protein n=2 Tax=Burkholderia humptydooensis TaxID=430531 RepID=A0A7U4P9U2_9BURK|nr:MULTISPECIES: CmpA/NrtA family ABC transporter substrate-binding protein [Burkholderia]AJY39307.1 NMT1-like family protein [Burkholderia sp. 2002721687]ALX45611.1 nitrate ABC transporter substrate-binding protein [Burkholderia humptydooensis]EIP86563.1 regulatory protein NasS, putative [Burkholderia humptydooensis MSMB43]QPS47100.1 ABC transporter substrate-binding protein [Burkholderia humptydooensis]